MNIIFLSRGIGHYQAARMDGIRDRVEKNGHSFMSLTLDDTTPAKRRRFDTGGAVDYNFRHETLGLGNISPYSLRAFFLVLKKIYGEKPDVIFTVGYAFSFSLAALIYGFFFRKKVIFCADSKFDDEVRSPLKEWIKRLIAKQYDGAIVAGNRHVPYYKFLGLSAEKIKVGFDVIDNEYFKKQSEFIKLNRKKVAQDLKLPDRYIICISRLIARKNVEKVIEAYAKSHAPASGVKLLIVGGGPLKDGLMAQVVQEELSDRVVFASDVSYDSMVAYVALAEFLVLLSEYDQWGMCVNEAVACGVPVICSPGCGVANEILMNGENGLIVDPDEGRVSEAFNYFLSGGGMLNGSSGNRIDAWGLSRLADNVEHFL